MLRIDFFSSSKKHLQIKEKFGKEVPFSYAYNQHTLTELVNFLEGDELAEDVAQDVIVQAQHACTVDRVNVLLASIALSVHVSDGRVPVDFSAFARFPAIMDTLEQGDARRTCLLGALPWKQ